MNIFTEAAKLEEQNCPFAMAQIVDSRGSTPRHSAQMLVRADGSIVGTIGGGMVERKVIEESLQALQERKPRLFHGRMARNGADAVGSDCGGAMSVFISVHGMRPRLVLIGAGHVNRAIAQSAALLGFDIAVADIYRESLNPELFPPSTTLLHAESFGAAVEALDIRPDNFVLIATKIRIVKPSTNSLNNPLHGWGCWQVAARFSFSCANCVRKAWLKNILPVYMRPLVTT